MNRRASDGFFDQEAPSSGPRELAEMFERLLGDSLELDGRVAGAHWRRALIDPALEFMARPGKQLRARVLECGFALAGGDGAPPERLSLAIELLHAGSLIVDDIEDGSPSRRGGPALHLARGLATALNTGNWLYILALDELARSGVEEAGEPADRRALHTLLRCHHGQALDVSIRACELDQSEHPGVASAITALKTASLVELAARLGAAAAGADGARARALARFGHELGVYLQMLDDLSSVTASARRDKGAEDLTLSRVTWVWAWLAETLDGEAFARLQRAARDVAAGAAPDPLIDDIGARIRPAGRRAAQAKLASAMAMAREAAGARAHADALWREIQSWEAKFGV